MKWGKDAVKFKRTDNIIWAAHRDLKRRPSGYVSCFDDQAIELCVQYPGDISHTIRIERKLARLLAKRINQCLDET